MRVETLETEVGRIELYRGGDALSGDASAISDESATTHATPLVYLHSANGEAAGMTLLEILAASGPVFAPVFPGFGSSEGIEHIDDIEDAAFHVLDVLDSLGLPEVDLVGMSLGGWMAAEVAVRWPGRVRRMVLVNAVGLYVEGCPITEIFGRKLDELAGELYADPDFPVAALMREMAAFESDPGAIPFDLVRPVVQAQAATAKLGWNPYLHNPKLHRRLGRITSPTLVVRATRDRIVPVEHARAYAQGIPRASLVEVDDAAHLAAIEKPVEVAGLVSAHLDPA